MFILHDRKLAHLGSNVRHDVVLEDWGQDGVGKQLRWCVAQIGFQGSEGCVCGCKHCRDIITASNFWCCYHRGRLNAPSDSEFEDEIRWMRA